MDGVNWYYYCFLKTYIPAHLDPSPKYPDGQGGHSAPTSGAGASIHSASWKHDTSVHPSTSTVQNSPSHAVCIEIRYNYREKSIPIIALWCPAFSNHGWNTTAYYSYYFDYLLSLLFKGPCRTLGIDFR